MAGPRRVPSAAAEGHRTGSRRRYGTRLGARSRRAACPAAPLLPLVRAGQTLRCAARRRAPLNGAGPTRRAGPRTTFSESTGRLRRSVSSTARVTPEIDVTDDDVAMMAKIAPGAPRRVPGLLHRLASLNVLGREP